jgi:hypothetical protein
MRKGSGSVYKRIDKTKVLLLQAYVTIADSGYPV